MTAPVTSDPACGSAIPVAAPARLVLGQVPPDFDADRDLAIGPWCFQGVEAAFPGWDDLVFVDPYPNEAHLAEDADAVRHLADFYADRLWPRFNRVHGTGHGPEFWRILLLPWLLYVIQALWHRFRHVAAFIAVHGNRPLTADVADGDGRWSIADMDDLNTVLNRHDFQHWLTSAIVAALAPPAWRLQRIPQPRQTPEPKAGRVAEPSAWRRMVDGVNSQLYRGRCRWVTGIKMEAPLFSFLLALLPPRRGLKVSREAPRCSIVDVFPSRFFDLLHPLMETILPRHLGEDFHRHHRQAARHRYRAGKFNLVGPVVLFNTAEQFRLALARQAGEHLICCQHGGSGFQRVNINSVATEQRQAAYFSWGWDAQQDYGGRIVALPSPWFSKATGRHRETEATLIFAGNTARIFSGRHETGIYGNYAIAYRKEKLAFLKQLPRAVFSHLRYRPYGFEDVGLDEVGYLRRHLPDLRLMNGTSKTFHHRLMACRLLVVDHLATSFCLALAANVPTIAICDLNAFHVSRQAAPLIEALKRAGILFEDGQAAARAVAAIWNDVPGWWNASQRQGARRSFCRRYARADRLWWWRWMQAICRLK